MHAPLPFRLKIRCAYPLDCKRILATAEMIVGDGYDQIVPIELLMHLEFPTGMFP
jgi:hypothetical protein